jgi:hypothetical protein
MSYTGSDDQPLCDGPCSRMYPPGWPDWITPSHIRGQCECDNFHPCPGLPPGTGPVGFTAPRRAYPGPPEPRPLAGQLGLLREAEAVVRRSTA